MEGVPASLRPWLQAAAAVRWFNQHILKEVVGAEIEDDAYEQLRHFPFVRPHEENMMIHDAIREIIDENVRVQNPGRYLSLHSAAATIFSTWYARAAEADRFKLLREWLYHVAKSGDAAGGDVVRAKCEELAAAGRVRELRAILTELRSIRHLHADALPWLSYYGARRLLLEGHLQEAEAMLDELAGAVPSGATLSRYVYCSLASIRTRWNRLGTGDDRALALRAVDEALSGELDSYLANALFYGARVCASQGDWQAAASLVTQAQDYFVGQEDVWGAVKALNELQAVNVLQGRWSDLMATEDQARNLLIPPFANAYLRARTLGYWSWGHVFAGRLRKAELQTAESVAFARATDDTTSLCVYRRNLALAIGFQGRMLEGLAEAQEAVRLAATLGEPFAETHATSTAILGLLLIQATQFDEASRALDSALATKRMVGDCLGIPEVLCWKGRLEYARGEPLVALEYYRQSLDWRWIGRRHCESEALLGVSLSFYAIGDVASFDAAIDQAIDAAKSADFNDHLAWTHLLKGHRAFDVVTSAKSDVSSVVREYQNALARSLLYNRFVLDEIAIAIATRCSAGGHDGRRVLARLTKYWTTKRVAGSGRGRKTRTAQEQTSRAPIDLERDIRAIEPGNGKKQQTVLEILSSR